MIIKPQNNLEPCLSYFGKRLKEDHCGKYWHCEYCEAFKEKEDGYNRED